MTRLAVTPLLVAAGMALIVHFLAAAQPDCRPSAYWAYIGYFFSNWEVAIFVLGPPFLPFIITAFLLRATRRLQWQWVGLAIIIAMIFVLMPGADPAQSCEDKGSIPELAPLIIGLFVTFPVFLVVTYIGSVQHARRKPH